MEITVKTNNKKIYENLLSVIKALKVDYSTPTEKVDVKKNTKVKNPLKGSVLKYEDPFGPACDIDDWEVLK